MNGHEFVKYLARDLHCPCGCEGREDTYVPQHRQGRGMGGSPERDRPANIIVMCAELNGRIESDADAAAEAREFGWKLAPWQDPAGTPFYDSVTGEWYLLDDDYGRILVADYFLPKASSVGTFTPPLPVQDDAIWKDHAQAE